MVPGVLVVVLHGLLLESSSFQPPWPLMSAQARSAAVAADVGPGEIGLDADLPPIRAVPRRS
jgi:hypothetical protein